LEGLSRSGGGIGKRNVNETVKKDKAHKPIRPSAW